MNKNIDITPIVRHYEACLDKHGPTHEGVDWPNADDLATRFSVMLDCIRPFSQDIPDILDLGCGPGLLLDHLTGTKQRSTVKYTGYDVSEKMVAAAHQRWPGEAFEVRDIITDPPAAESYDYVIMNGVLTEKCSLPHEEMAGFAKSLISAAFHSAKIGIAFNVMSPNVDWERDDLFYWPYEELAGFLSTSVSRKFIFRADYGLYEYTTYLYKAS